MEQKVSDWSPSKSYRRGDKVKLISGQVRAISATSPLRILPAEPPARVAGPVPTVYAELPDVIDSVCQKLQALMGHVSGNGEAETLLERIAADLRDYARATEPGSGKFVAIKSAVMMNSRHVATACSHTMAKRIAKALSNHKPTREGV